MSDKVPDEFDWVTARSRCSIDDIFLVMFEVVKSDLKKMEELVVGRGSVRYALNWLTGDKFIAARHITAGRTVVDSRSVIFQRIQGAVHVKRVTPENTAGETLFMARPHVVPVEPDGLCALEVDGRGPLKLWQVSQLALEGLFYEE